jgi:hypothetical protein
MLLARPRGRGATSRHHGAVPKPVTAMMSRLAKVVAVGVGGFVIAFGAIIIYWLSAGGDPGSCTSESCGLEYVAVVTGAIVTGLLVGASCGLLTYVVIKLRENDQ